MWTTFWKHVWKLRMNKILQDNGKTIIFFSYIRKISQAGVNAEGTRFGLTICVCRFCIYITKDIISRWAENMSVSQNSSMKSLDMTSGYRRRTGQWRILFLSNVGFFSPVSSWYMGFPIFNPLVSNAETRACIVYIKWWEATRMNNCYIQIKI